MLCCLLLSQRVDGGQREGARVNSSAQPCVNTEEKKKKNWVQWDKQGVEEMNLSILLVYAVRLTIRLATTPVPSTFRHTHHDTLHFPIP